MFEWPMNTSSAEITESCASVPYAKSAVANTVLTASARSAADAQANTTAAVSALGVKRRAGITTVTVPALYVRCVASAKNRQQSVSVIEMFRQPTSVSDWRAEVVVRDRETSEGLSTQVREHCRYAGKN